MIDFETKIFNAFYPSVSTMCAKDGVRSTYSPSYTKFPCVIFREMDNMTVRRKQDSSREEFLCRVTYVFEIYAQTKSEARKIFKAGDDQLIAMNFIRLSAPITDDGSDPTVVRIVARYEADIDQNGMIYRS